jgi:hypothetical protein
VNIKNTPSRRNSFILAVPSMDNDDPCRLHSDCTCDSDWNLLACRFVRDCNNSTVIVVVLAV